MKNLLKYRVICSNNKSFFSTKIDNIKQREQIFVDKVALGSGYSHSDFSSFLRHVNKHPGDKKLIDTFCREIRVQINTMDHLDLRKAISIVLANQNLHSDEDLLSLLKERFAEIRKLKDMDDFTNRIKIGADLNSQPYSVRFWIMFARFRERFYMRIRKFGLNLK